MNLLTISIIIGVVIAIILGFKKMPWTTATALVVCGLIFIPPVFSTDTVDTAVAVSYTENGSYVTSAADPAASQAPAAAPVVKVPKKQNVITKFISTIFGASSDPDGVWVHTGDVAGALSNPASSYLG